MFVVEKQLTFTSTITNSLEIQVLNEPRTDSLTIVMVTIGSTIVVVLTLLLGRYRKCSSLSDLDCVNKIMKRILLCAAIPIQNNFLAFQHMLDVLLFCRTFHKSQKNAGESHELSNSNSSGTDCLQQLLDRLPKSLAEQVKCCWTDPQKISLDKYLGHGNCHFCIYWT